MKHTGYCMFALLLLLSASRFIAVTLDEVGSSLDEVKRQTVYQLAQDHFSPYYTTQIKDACKKLPPGVREATMLTIGKYIRDYVESTQFKEDYEKYLHATYTGSSFDANDPRWESDRKQKFDELTAFMSNPNTALVEMVVNSMDVDVQTKEALIKMISDPAMKALAGQMPAQGDLLKDIEDDKMLKALYKSDPPSFKKKYPEIMANRTVRDEMTQAKGNAVNNTQKAENDIAKRIDFQVRLRQQLQEFLDATANIDFNAVTQTNADGIKKFVNPAYEQKDGYWKFYYRCGKESVTGARKYAQGWLAALPH